MQEKKEEQNITSDQGKPFEAHITLIVPKEEKEERKGFDIRRFEAFISLVKVLAWPLVLLFLFLMLREPIGKILAMLPEKISESTKISVGSLSLEIQQAAKAAGNPELAKLIKGLSSEAVEELLFTGRSDFRYVGGPDVEGAYILPTESKKKALLELEKKGLLEYRMPMEEFDRILKRLPLIKIESVSDDRTKYKATRPLSPAEQEDIESQGSHLTSLGLRALDLIVASVVQQLQTPDPNDSQTKQ